MNFEMPKLSQYEVNKLIDVALSDCNFWAGQARKHRDAGDEKEADSITNGVVAEESARYEAWVNWSRQEFPDRPCNFMLDDEPERYGCSLPFQVPGDRWEHDGTRWNIMRKGRIVTKRK